MLPPSRPSLTVSQLVDAQFDLGEVASAEVSVEAVQAHSLPQGQLLHETLIVTQLVNQPRVRCELAGGQCQVTCRWPAIGCKQMKWKTLGKQLVNGYERM